MEIIDSKPSNYKQVDSWLFLKETISTGLTRRKSKSYYLYDSFRCPRRGEKGKRCKSVTAPATVCDGGTAAQTVL